MSCSLITGMPCKTSQTRSHTNVHCYTVKSVNIKLGLYRLRETNEQKLGSSNDGVHYERRSSATVQQITYQTHTHTHQKHEPSDHYVTYDSRRTFKSSNSNVDLHLQVDPVALYHGPRMSHTKPPDLSTCHVQ